MFSGIIQSLGTIVSVENRGTTKQVRIHASLAPQLHVDQSLSHDGVCLTVTAIEDEYYTVEVVAETLSKTTLQWMQPGQQFNLEKSITPQSLLDGHLVQGHVDTTLKCVERIDLNGSWKFTFELPAEYAHLVIPHGSICLNGVSLTIANLFDDTFDVAIIPYTFSHTNFQSLQAGQSVNVEFDLIGKYLFRQTRYSPTA